MQERDDMQVLTYEYNGDTFCYRLLDTNIKTYDKGKHFNFIVPVCEKDNKVKEFQISFRVEADDIDMACQKTEEAIRNHLERQK